VSDYKNDHLQRILLFAPIVFICHFAEEAPGFVNWFNAHVSQGITARLFFQVNLSALIITVLVIGIYWYIRPALVIVVTWLSFLMLANAFLHIAGALIDRGYVPGLVTAVILYLPYYSWLCLNIFKSRRIRLPAFIFAVVFGSVPMLLHGYLILFRASRLL